MGTTAPSGDWLDRILNSASDFGEKYLDYKSWQFFSESDQADAQDRDQNGWGDVYGPPYMPPQQDNTMLYVGIGVAVLAVILLMKK